MSSPTFERTFRRPSYEGFCNGYSQRFITTKVALGQQPQYHYIIREPGLTSLTHRHNEFDIPLKSRLRQYLWYMLPKSVSVQGWRPEVPMGSIAGEAKSKHGTSLDTR